MRRTLLGFLNPVKWVKAWRYKKRQSKLDPSSFDLELYLYSQLLTTDMLHYGYFDDVSRAPETISIRDFEDAQLRYAELLMAQINNNARVLDVGCGMGGLAHLIAQRGFDVEAVTPNDQQVHHVRKKYPGVACHHSKFEDFNSERRFGTIINSESLQYIPLDAAFKKVDALRSPGTTWIICDYFKRHEQTRLRSSHLLSQFKEKAAEHGWRITHEEDISMHVLPTIRMGEMYANRFLKPVTHFAGEKLRHKKAGLYYMLTPLRELLERKVGKITATVNAEEWRRDKQYMLFVLKKD